MTQAFIKDGTVRLFNVIGTKVMATILIGGHWVICPSLDRLYADGWEDYIVPAPPTPTPPTKDELFWDRYVELKREKYSVDLEFERLRQRTTKALDFATYYDDCDDFKKQAYREIYGTNPPLNL